MEGSTEAVNLPAAKPQGAIVWADLVGSPRSPNLGGSIPDIFALFPDSGEVAVEVENERSATKGHARKQDRAFRSRAEAGPRL